MDRISLNVNGVEYSVGCEISSNVTLLDYAREYLELRGTKYMCRQAGCGACVVTARRPPGLPYAVNSCILPVTSCNGLEITTIENVGNRKKGYHPLQKTLAEYNGSQCGYCSPGWIMAMYRKYFLHKMSYESTSVIFFKIILKCMHIAIRVGPWKNHIFILDNDEGGRYIAA